MPECPICRRTYDARFAIFVAGVDEPFDTIDCARRATSAGALGLAPAATASRPTLEVVVPGQAPAEPAPTRRGIAAFSMLMVPPRQAALAAGVGLVAAGTAASIYLLVKPTTHAPVASGGSPTRVAPPAAAPPKLARAAIGAAATVTGPAVVERRSARRATRPPGPKKTQTHVPKQVQTHVPNQTQTHVVNTRPSAAQAQYGQFELPSAPS
jgi:hypothetical protein